jgi:NhaP-type Na+/H+ or K+/H+ antiporter
VGDLGGAGRKGSCPLSSTELAIGLGAIVVLGVGSQWVAYLTRVPSIVLLLLAGIVAGPVTGIVDPDELFGSTLDPAVSLAVGLLLFDSGLNLDFRKLTTGGRAVRRLVLVGGTVTWLLGWLAAYLIFDISAGVAALLAAVLVVSGPTVIQPILAAARPNESLGTILTWEGTILDPIGGALAIVVLSAISSSSFFLGPAARMVATTAVGVGIGLACGVVFLVAVRQLTIPDDLLVPVAFMFAVLAFTVANVLFAEAGIFATLTLGLVLANQEGAPVREVGEFQKIIGTLIIAVLFVVLAATIELDALASVVLPSIALLAVLVIIVRPVAAYIATMRTGMDWRDRAFAACVAPRGIVAASTVSFAVIALKGANIDDGDIVPITFAVIIGAGIVYGFGSPIMARVLGVQRGFPKGVAIFAESTIADPMAMALAQEGVSVLVVGSWSGSIPDDRAYDFYRGDLYDDDFDDALAASDIGSAVIASPHRGPRMFARERCLQQMRSRNIFTVPVDASAGVRGLAVLVSPAPPKRVHPFSPDINQDRLRRMMAAGEPRWVEPQDGRWQIPDGFQPLFVVSDDLRAVVSTDASLSRALKIHTSKPCRVLTWSDPDAQRLPPEPISSD